MWRRNGWHKEGGGEKDGKREGRAEREFIERKKAGEKSGAKLETPSEAGDTAGDYKRRKHTGLPSARRITVAQPFLQVYSML